MLVQALVGFVFSVCCSGVGFVFAGAGPSFRASVVCVAASGSEVCSSVVGAMFCLAAAAWLSVCIRSSS